jgi:zinc transport system substrate-binding protein
VIVSIAPLRGLVEPMVRGVDGDRADVSLLIPIGASEHGYEIPPKMMAAVVHADVVVYVGMGLEPHLAGLLLSNPNPAREVVCFADVVGLAGGASEHQDGDEQAGAHDEEHGPDPHLWLDPVLVEKLIPKVHGAVERAAARRGDGADLEKKKAAVAAAADALSRQVREVDEAYRSKLGPLPDRVIVTAHAAWGRMAGRYGLEQVALAGLEASEASPDAIARAVETIREHRATTVFTEPEISAALADRIADETGARVEVLDPLGNGDWAAMMKKNLEAIVSGLSRSGGGSREKRVETPPR